MGPFFRTGENGKKLYARPKGRRNKERRTTPSVEFALMEKKMSKGGTKGQMPVDPEASGEKNSSITGGLRKKKEEKGQRGNAQSRHSAVTVASMGTREHRQLKKTAKGGMVTTPGEKGVKEQLGVGKRGWE